MSMRPIDLQSMVTRSYEVNRSNSVDASRSEMQQQQFAKQLNKEAQKEEQMVTETNKSESGVINKDSKNKNQQDKRESRKQSEKQKAAAKALKEYKSSSMVDIKI